MAYVAANGTEYVPAFNGTLIDSNLCTNAICPLTYAQFDYIPTKAGNLAYLIIFALLLAIHLGLGIRYRTWGFMVGAVGGTILEVVGYYGRYGLSNNDFDFNSFIIYIVCLTIGPAFISASIYLCLSRIIIVYSRNIARFSPKLYTIFFVCCDFISLVLQGAGGGIAATSNNDREQGQMGVNIMIAGLSFQVVSLFIFAVLSIDFILSVRKTSHHRRNPSFTSLRETKLFRAMPLGLAIATVFIFIRCCYRVAELKDGFSGSLANNEVTFMIFEGPMIFIACIALAICHPGICFGGRQTWKAANWTWKKSPAEDYGHTNVEMTPKGGV